MKNKKKLIWQIFPSFLIITLLSLTIVAFYSTRYFKQFYLKNSEKELTIQTQLLRIKFSDILQIDPAWTLQVDRQCKEIGEQTGTRVTVILPSGKVVGDSFGDVNTMENHRDRPEIIVAMKGQKGVSIRFSETLGKNMMYIAIPVKNNDEIAAIVRSSVSISTVDKAIQKINNNIFIALILIILAAAIASLFVTRRITHPIEEMKRGATEFAKGNLNKRLAVPTSEELSELAVTMNRMAENLDLKIQDAKNRSMELEAVHTSMQEGVIAIDREERIITINQAAAKIFDFPSVKVKTRYILEVARNIQFQAFIQRALSTHEPVEEDIIIQKDDDIILNIHSTALYDVNRQRIGTLIIFHDITRIRRLERMHKDFAANVSHELKTPLTTIKGFIETLQEMLDSNDTEQSRHFLEIIEKNVNRMTDLINDLLALSKLERLEGTGVGFEEQPLFVLIQGAIANCRTAMQAKQIEIQVDCPEELDVLVDPLLMEQAIINLVDNGIKYSPESSMISIKVAKRDGLVDISIQDQGSGIDKEHLPKIFNRFYRVDKARSRHAGGTGLGLAIVKHIVQFHLGSVHVESQKDKGTTFRISLPAVPNS